MHKMIIVPLLYILMLGCGEINSNSDKAALPLDTNYIAYSEMLNRYLSDGRVDYQGLKDNRAALDSLVKRWGKVDLDDVSENHKLAFYINAYNILTLRSVIDAYPVKSIKDINGVWDKKKWLVSGQQLTLNDIEHEILRKEFAEPQIHFAIVCASIGCLPLAPVPYLADSLDIQLATAARNFATSAFYNRFEPENGKAFLSQIFDWFGEDFIDIYYDNSKFPNLPKKENSVLNFLIRLYPEEVQQKLSGIKYSIEYLEYDWSLNDGK